MSKALSFKEFSEIVNFIKDHRSFGMSEVGYPSVKYIDPVFDMRTNVVFFVTFRTGNGVEKKFSCTNEERYLTESMYGRIMQWLNTPR